uniref:transposase n=1 Tax=Candidatus Protofrankia californiensis TaxID=1839754 RepID=UPI0013E9C8DD
AVAVDGKTSRGARRRDGSRVHLLGVVEHGSGHLVDHVEVDAKSNETTAFQSLLSGLELAGATVTFDALHSVRANLDWLLRAKGGHYLTVVKKTSPPSMAGCVPCLGLRSRWASAPATTVTAGTRPAR